VSKRKGLLVTTDKGDSYVVGYRTIELVIVVVGLLLISLIITTKLYFAEKSVNMQLVSTVVEKQTQIDVRDSKIKELEENFRVVEENFNRLVTKSGGR